MRDRLRIEIGCAVLLLGLFVRTGFSEVQNERYRSDEFAKSFVRTAETVFAPLYGPLAEHIVTSFGLAEEEGVGIDIGGGAGNLAVELARRTLRMHWINADINPSFFPYVARLAENEGVSDRVGSIAVDARDMPFRDGYADVVVSRGSFHLWDDKVKAFSEVYRILKPGGIAYIGRGFSENLPVETAREIRKKQGGGPRYDVDRTAEELEGIMKVLDIKDFTVFRPVPPGSGGVNYGVWIEFHKPGPGRRAVMREEKKTEPVTGGRSVYVLEPIEVTGTRTREVIQTPLVESSGLEPSTTVVKRADIERQGAKTVFAALEYVPGAWVETRGRKVKQFFSVRGQKYPYPEYAVDGALFREFHEIPYFFSSADIERIEVLRSSAAMLTGISGLTGVVNIIPKTYTEPETSWEVEYGSFDTYRAHLSHGGAINDVSYSLGIDTPHTDGPSGRHAAEAMSNFQGTVAWRISPALSVRTSLFHINGERELARAEPPAAARFQETVEEFDPFRTTFAAVRALYRPSENVSTDVLLFYADRDHMFQNESDTGHVSTRERDYEWGMNAVQAVTLSETNTLRIGGYYNRWIAPNGKRFYIGRKCDLETFAGAVVDEHNFGRLTVDAGLRLEKTHMRDYGAFNINASAKGFAGVEAVSDEWEPVKVTASIGTSYRITPALSFHTAVSAGQVKPREGTLDINGEQPENESRIKAETGIIFSGACLERTSLVGFVTRQNNAIALSGQVDTVDGRTMELYVNRDQYQTGVEIDARSKPVYDITQFFLNATVMRSRARIDGKMSKNEEMPTYILGGGIYAAYENYDCNLFWKYASSYESTRFVASSKGNPAVPQPLGDYNTLNLTAGRSFGKSLRSRVYVEVRNLTDKRFSTVVGFPDFGRRYTVGIRQEF